MRAARAVAYSSRHKTRSSPSDADELASWVLSAGGSPESYVAVDQESPKYQGPNSEKSPAELSLREFHRRAS
jgi:hypothetical protein